MKAALVTGGSSGIGRACARALADMGCRVYEFSRRNIPQEGVTHLSGDVCDEKAMSDAVNTILKDCGCIDILVCCAGFGISGAVEFTELSDAGRQLDVNFFGTVNAVKAVLPHMRQQGRGRIVCTSSVAGAIPIPFQTYYSVSKAAINAYVRALRCEVAPYGIRVCAVMPGDISTGFTAAREKSPVGDDIYGGRISRSVAGMEKDEQKGGTPAAAGRFLARRALQKRAVKPLYTIGLSYRLFTLLERLLPRRFLGWLVYLLYAR